MDGPGQYRVGPINYAYITTRKDQAAEKSYTRKRSRLKNIIVTIFTNFKYLHFLLQLIFLKIVLNDFVKCEFFNVTYFLLKENSLTPIVETVKALGYIQCAESNKNALTRIYMYIDLLNIEHL